nr:hypothetical protein Iba_chr14dCG7750 [Ipomoea batatas]
MAMIWSLHKPTIELSSGGAPAGVAAATRRRLIRVLKIWVVLLHEPHHSIVPQPNHLKLLFREVIGVVPVRILEPVEQALRHFLASQAGVPLRLPPDLSIPFDAPLGGLPFAPAGEGSNISSLAGILGLDN